MILNQLVIISHVLLKYNEKHNFSLPSIKFHNIENENIVKSLVSQLSLFSVSTRQGRLNEFRGPR